MGGSPVTTPAITTATANALIVYAAADTGDNYWTTPRTGRRRASTPNARATTPTSSRRSLRLPTNPTSGRRVGNRRPRLLRRQVGKPGARVGAFAVPAPPPPPPPNPGSSGSCDGPRRPVPPAAVSAVARERPGRRRPRRRRRQTGDLEGGLVAVARLRRHLQRSVRDGRRGGVPGARQNLRRPATTAPPPTTRSSPPTAKAA